MSPDFPSGAALVVGGSGGIGSAICRRLAEAGSDVALTYHNNRDAAERVTAAVTERGRAGSAYQLSAADSDRVHEVISQTVLRFGSLHTVIYAAGPDIGQPFLSDVTPAEWREVIEQDANGFFNLVHATLPRLRAAGGGSVVAVTTAGLVRYPPRDILSVGPKAAVEAVITAIAREEGRYGIRANSVAMGVIETGIFQRLREAGEFDDELVEIMRQNIAMKRFGTAEEAAEVVVFLASARASFVTGQRVVVDGGYSL